MFVLYFCIKIVGEFDNYLYNILLFIYKKNI